LQPESEGVKNPSLPIVFIILFSKRTMKFLLIAFLLFLFFIFMLGFSALRMIFGGLFGLRSKPDDRSKNQQKTKQSGKKTPPQSKKIITPDEGEYIDFEEIKD
jgi:hypothetical protein